MVFIWTYNLTMHHLTLGTDKENIKGTIEPYQRSINKLLSRCENDTWDLPSVADAGDRCQPDQVLEN